MTNQKSSIQQKQFLDSNYLWWLLGLVLPVVFCAVRSVSELLDIGTPFDTTHTYLPLAKGLLEDSTNFWHRQEILKTAPGTFVYMALWGADLLTIKTVNLAMALLTLMMLFDTCRRVAGWAAGSTAAWLYAVSPTLFPLSVAPMMEPPFLFLVTLWFWASSWCITEKSRHFATALGIFLAGTALAAATLTRATYMYWIPAAALGFGALGYSSFLNHRSAWKRISTIHLLAAVLVGGYILHNALEFKKPAIAVGAGAALYFGNNAMIGGQEPPYFGLGHDEGAITGGAGHLSIEGDARLISAAKLIISETPPLTLAKMYTNKMGALLFFSKSHMTSYGARLWRAFLLVLALTAVFLGYRLPVIWLISGAAFYQLVVHIPVLYNQRYSISALDIPLTLLAALGVGMLFQQKSRARTIGTVSAALLLCLFASAWHQRYAAPALVNLDAIPHRLLKAAAPDEIKIEGLEGDPFQALATTSSGHFVLTWQSDQMPALDGVSVVRLKVEKMEGSCRRVWLAQFNQQGEGRSDPVNLNGFGPHQDFARGALFIQVSGKGKKISLTFECNAGTRFKFSELGAYEASLGITYRSKVTESSHQNQIEP
ncbi:hypothetical protein [Delftia acidovorans]|uniref:hypothetical protein n=1 Tax=Delftia acidovorans TaxID=80866 RepID=UPI0024327014|nr:hypothetical protein [Delftia acidovorans]